MNNWVAWADQTVVLLLVPQRTDKDVDAQREVEQAEAEFIGNLRRLRSDRGAQ